MFVAFAFARIDVVETVRAIVVNTVRRRAVARAQLTIVQVLTNPDVSKRDPAAAT